MKITPILLGLLVAARGYAQLPVPPAGEASGCPCPPIKLYVYDTRITFKPDSPISVKDGGDYIVAQASGDDLEADYVAQQSDELKVYKSMGPNGGAVHTNQLPGSGPPPDGIDFYSYIQVDRSNQGVLPSYIITLEVFDAHYGTEVKKVQATETDLGQITAIIANEVQSLGSVVDFLRNYQEQMRNRAHDYWIAVKWKATPDKKSVKIGESTKVHIQLFDCADQKPVANKEVRISQTNTSIGKLSVDQVTTDDNGEAVVTFTGKNNGDTRITADLTYTDIYGRSGNQATNCGDKPEITVADSTYQIKFKMDLSGTGPDGTPERCVITGQAVVRCNPTTDTSSKSCCNWAGVPDNNMQMTVEQLYFTSKDVKTTYQSPMTFKNPFTLSIDYCSPLVSFNLNFTKFGPSQETYTTSKGGMVILSKIMSTLFKALMSDQAIDKYQQYEGRASELQALADRMEVHHNDPAYFKTAQGQKDMALLKELNSQFGTIGPGAGGKAASHGFGGGPGSGAPGMTATLGGINGPFDKGSAMPVNITVKARRMIGNGWDSGTVTLTMQKM